GPSERRLLVDFETEDGRACRDVPAETVVAGNARRYGGALRLAREAATDDGVLELALLPTTRLWPLIRAGVTALLAELRAAPGVEVVRVRRARVRAPGPVPVHVDAESFGHVPVDVGV